MKNTKNNWTEYGKAYSLDHENESAYFEYQDIINLLNLDKGKLLDFGCNTGNFLNLIKNKFHKINLIGIDINNFAISRARKKYPQIEFICGDINDINGEYDYIVLIEVIEHIKNPITFLEKIKKHLAPNGTIIMSTPNKWAFSTKLGCLITGEKFCYDPTHLHEFSPNSLKNIVKKSGLKVQKIKTKPFGIPIIQIIPEKLKEKIPGWLIGNRLYLVAR